ncbi:MAG: hypothetical protein V5A68_06715 [Candidatus Thermoplasmatota archaeon]
MYHRGLSYRDTEKILSVFEPCSYEAVHYWYRKFQQLFAVNRRQRNSVWMKLRLNEKTKQVYLWIAVDA